MLNTLYDLQESQKNPKQIQKVFGGLRDYIQLHFTTEETYIKSHGCPDSDVQKKEHEKFIDTICSYQKDFLKEKPLAIINLFNYVWDWFAHHIVVVDKRCLSAGGEGAA